MSFSTINLFFEHIQIEDLEYEAQHNQGTVGNVAALEKELNRLQDVLEAKDGELESKEDVITKTSEKLQE